MLGVMEPYVATWNVSDDRGSLFKAIFKWSKLGGRLKTQIIRMNESHHRNKHTSEVDNDGELGNRQTKCSAKLTTSFADARGASKGGGRRTEADRSTCDMVQNEDVSNEG
jgi:hypothetical protein